MATFGESHKENRLLLDQRYLLCADTKSKVSHYHTIEELKNNFCGKIISNPKQINITKKETIIYLYGDITENFDVLNSMSVYVYIIKDISWNYSESDFNDSTHLVSLGEVPVNVNNVGVLFIVKFLIMGHLFSLLLLL